MVKWESIEPKKVEWIVRNLYTRLGYQSINTSYSKDGGIDVIAKFFDKDREIFLKFIIQVKRWSHNVGVKAVRELHGVQNDQKADKAICVSTSDFTKTAIDYASRNDIDLVNRVTFENLLEKTGLLNYNGSLVSFDDPNLPRNRYRAIMHLLSLYNTGLNEEQIITQLFTPDFGITVNKNVLLDDINDLSSRGEIIEENDFYYKKISDVEINYIINSLHDSILELNGIFNIGDVYDFISNKYNVPSVTSYRQISIEPTLIKLKNEGKIMQISQNVFMPLKIFNYLKKFDWTQDEIKSNILNVMGLDETCLSKTMKEICIYLNIPEGPLWNYYDNEPFSGMPYFTIHIHFCDGENGGIFFGAASLPLFAPIYQMFSDDERDLVKIVQRDEHLASRPGVRIEGLELIKDKGMLMADYASKLIDIVKEFNLDEIFELSTDGMYLSIFNFLAFEDDFSFNDAIEILTEKGYILANFFKEVWKRCPPPITFQKMEDGPKKTNGIKTR